METENKLEQTLACLLHVSETFLLAWVLRFLFYTYIILAFASLNAYAKHMPGVHTELGWMFRWWHQRWAKLAPSNKRIDKILDKVSLDFQIRFNFEW